MTPAPMPSADELDALARDTAGRCGVDVDALGATVATTSPINGERLRRRDLGRRGRRRRRRRAGQQAFRTWRRCRRPCAARGQAAAASC